MKKKMRYIRTKETDCCIIDTIKYKEITGEDCFIPKNEIVKEADTIEELCDEFVGINNGKPQMLRFVPYACAQYWNGGVYGAIWTEKGLIYVAKLNDKRELELL